MKLLKTIKRMTWLRGKIDLGRGPVLSTLIKLSIPSIAMVLFHTLFHLVDTVFISWLGTSHMVAISYTFPVQIGVFAVLEGVGNGMTALCGRRLGEGNLSEARDTALAGMGFAYLLCLIWIPFLFPYTSNMFFKTLGASDPETLRQAWLYNMWIPPTCILISFAYVVNSVFRCQGNTMIPLKYFLISNSINIILDPILIFVLGWGITGAAAATFAGRLAGIVYLIKKLRTESDIQVPFKPCIRFSMAPLWRKITAIGFPVTLSTASVALGMGSVNNILSGTFGPHAVAAWMVGLRIEDIAFNTPMGINDALVPFLAFNYGRCDLKRMEKGIRSALIISTVITGGLGLIVCLFPFPFIRLFRPTEDIAVIAAQAIRITIAGYPMVIYSVIYNALFVATGFSAFGLITQIFRSLVIRVPAAHFLSGILPLDKIWWFQPVSFLGAAFMTGFFSWVIMRKLKRDIGTPKVPSA
ncbi:MAG: MATE family efflux transporter [Synergistaceae bacterium]|nr:MATE family efflux transporter [Synergistaceae bacterium]